MQEITWAGFEKVKLRVGTILEVPDFPGAHNREMMHGCLFRDGWERFF
ncbi:hypothetical protein [Dyadobacter sandarakinus]|nr:hypothetical protein [Dyadobacter sandarakinus]